MEQLHNFETKIHLVEELEKRILNAASGDSDFWGYYLDSLLGFDYFDRYLQGPLLNEFIQYIYSRCNSLNNNEINSWLTISLNQFNTHRPELRKTFLKQKLQKEVLPRLAEQSPLKDADSFFGIYFKTIFISYEQNFYLFQNATAQAMEDFKKGFLVPFSKLSNQNFHESKIKIKTNLSVPQLAYLFKALKEEGIITSIPKEIYDVVTESFSSKQKEVISRNTIKNLFEAPELDAIEFWRKKFLQLVQNARQDKEK